MAYRAPRFAYLHEARRLGVAQLSCSPAADSAFPLRNLIDNVGGRLFKFGSSGTDSWVKLDRQAAGGSLDRLFVPPGHSLFAASGSLVWEASSDNFASDTESIASVAANTLSSSAPVVLEAGAGTSKRYQRLRHSGTGTWGLGELIWTAKVQPVYGPAPRWAGPHYRPSELATPLPDGGLAVQQLGPARITHTLSFEGQEGADLAKHRALAEALGHSTGVPFVFDPPDDAFSPVWMRLEQQLVYQQDHPNPAGSQGPSYSVLYTLVEQR